MSAPSSLPNPAIGRRLLLLASVSLLALSAASPAVAQSGPFARRGAAADPAAAAARNLQVQAQEAAAAQQHAQAALQVFARAAQTQAAMAGLQAAARAAAQSAAVTVPNGLEAGGLVPQTGASTWRGAEAPVQGAGSAADRIRVTVRQTESRAILTWQSFNVGRETDLRFDQSAGGTRAREWAVLNRVEDPTAQPSRILGSITAEGQVLVINRNGVVFGGASQVNVSTLIASALDLGGWGDAVQLRDQRFLDGLLTAPNQAGNLAPTLSHDMPARLRDGNSPRRIAVEVEAGARITLREEGSAILAAPVVVNAGSITAPRGQVMLAAGAGLRLDTPPVSRFGARIGLVAEPLRRGEGTDTSRLDAYPFEARNEGLLSAPSGNVTLAGYLATNAPGAVLSATTASNRPGSITIQARDFGGAASANTSGSPTTVQGFRFGVATLGQGSLVTVTAETGADQVVFNTATTPFEQSRLYLIGAAVRMEADAVVRAPAGGIRIAGDLPQRLFGNATSGGRLQTLLMEAGSVIDVGGLKDLTAPVSRNMIEVQPLRNELRDAPLQREGWLYSFGQRGERVTVDTRLGSAILDWQPVANGIPVSVAERQGTGGSIEIAAERVFALQGSRLDVSGGLMTWQGGERAAQTRLLGADGRVYRISDASADVEYVGRAGDHAATQPRWGVRQSFAAPVQAQRRETEAGYVEGLDAGSVSISGRFYGDGVVQGGAFTGTRQASAGRANDANPITTTDLPSGGALSFLGFRPVDSTDLPVTRTSGIGGLVNPTFVTAVETPLPADLGTRLDGPASINAADRRLRLIGDPLPVERFDTQLSTRDVINRGWSAVTIEADGRATLAEGVAISLPAGARFGLNSWSASIAGSIAAPAGAIAIAANAGDRVTAAAETLAAPALNRMPEGAPAGPMDGAIEIAAGAVLSVAGLWVNDFLAASEGGAPSGPAFLSGGSITLQTRFAPLRPQRGQTPSEIPPLPAGAVVDSLAVAVTGREIRLGEGALLDVSGGGRIASNGRTLTGARGGTLTLATHAGRAASPTGAPLVAGAIAEGLVGYYIAGAHAGVADAGAVLRGFGTGREGGGAANGLGGVFALAAPSLVVGRAPTEAEAAQGTRRVDLDALAAAGFSDLRLSAPIAGRVPFQGLPAGRIVIADGAEIAPLAASRILSADSRAAPTGAAAEAWSRTGVAAREDRAPMRLSFHAGSTLSAGDAATRIAADPGAARPDSAALVSLAAAQPMLLRGTLEAPAGAIEVTGTGPSGIYGVISGDSILREVRGGEFSLGHALWLAPTARLLAPGVADSVTTSAGLVAGGVRAGGSVTLQESRGYLVIEQGALIDVSGVAGRTTLLTGALPPDAGGSLALSGDAGSITLSGARGAFLDGTLRGEAGGPTARGGTLVLRSPVPVFIETATLAFPTPTISVPFNLTGFTGIVVRQAGSFLPAGLGFGDRIDASLVRSGAIAWSGGALTGQAFLAASGLDGSGIDRLYLAGVNHPVRFEGAVTLSLPRALQIEAAQIEAGPLGGAAPDIRLSAGYILLNGAIVEPLRATAPASGTLELAAGWIDVLGGVALRGAASVTLGSANDIRLVGTVPDVTDRGFGRVRGALDSQGDLTLRAAQVYTATGTAFQVNAIGAPGEAARTIRIEGPGGAPPAAPLSAGSILTVTAARIEQAGVLRAPQGLLRLRPAERLDLLPGSLTSVSAEGRAVPYGELVSDQGALGVALTPASFGPLAVGSGGIAAPPPRAIEIDTREVQAAAGAVLDVSGGGELLGVRFVSGPGGSRDVLARATVTVGPGGDPVLSNYQFADRRDVFAILPGVQPGAAPVSPYIVDSGTSLGRGDVTADLPVGNRNVYGQQVSGLLPTIGDQIRVPGGIPGLPAGSYTLLPGRYAILPGAYRVVLSPGQAGPAVARAEVAPVARPDGSWQVGVSRAVAGSALVEDRWRVAEIAPASTWRRYSDLTVTAATAFFAARAAALDEALPVRPVDGGRLTLVARNALVLDGTSLFGRGPGGRGGEVEISGDRIAVTRDGAPYSADGIAYFAVSDATIDALGAESVTIGGLRQAEATGQRLDIRAAAVAIGEGARLSAPDLLLLARRPAGSAARPGDGITIGAGAELSAEGAGGGTDLLLGRVPQNLFDAGLSGAGAVLRLTGAPGGALLRENAGTGTGTGVVLGAAARLEAGSVLLDVTGASTVAGDTRIAAAALDLGGASLVLGDPPSGTATGGIGLGNQVLAGLAGIESLTLRSRGAIDVHGQVALSGGTVLIDAAALRGFGDASLSVTAARVAGLRNSGAAAAGAAPAGAGTLALAAAEEIRLGGGAVAVSGFGTTRLETPGALVAAGTGSLALPGALQAQAALLAGAPGADLTLLLPGDAAFARPASAAPALPQAGLGARLAVEAGGGITLDTNLALPGGTVVLAAGTGDVRLGAAAAIDARGAERAFFDAVKTAPGGMVTLRSVGGSVLAEAGARIDVSAAAGGEAGEIALLAQRGAVEVGGAVLLGAAGPAQAGGGFLLDTGGAVDLGALDARLDAAGFFGRRVVHSRTGDLVLGAGSVFRAAEIGLTADGGSLLVGGTLDASGARGGRVALYARDQVELAPGARIEARGTEAGRPGGTVEIGTALGALRLDGATIDVTGNDPLRGSLVRLRLPEAALAGSGFGVVVAGARRVEVEPFRQITTAQLGQSAFNAAFNAAAAVDVRGLYLADRPAGWRVTPGLELRVDGPVSLAAALNLAALRSAAGDPGVLTLRAAGDLELLASISDGFAAAAPNALHAAGRSWSYRLVAGADLASANPMATRSAAPGAGGSVLVGRPWTFDLTRFVSNNAGNPATAPVTVRTGTGSIDIGAAGDVLLRDPDATVYTAGRPVAERNTVTATGPDGTTVTGHFFDPVAPTYAAAAPSLADIFTDPSVPENDRAYPAGYPVEGGDLRIAAGRDIRATVLDAGGNNAGQVASAWLYRQGAVDAETGLFIYRPAITETWQMLDASGSLPAVGERSSQTSWWINFSRFNQNFGLLGGGDATLRAGRDFQGSVSIPTTGRVGGGLAPSYSLAYRQTTAGSPVRVLSGTTPRGTGPAVLSVDGGGDLVLVAGRDVGAASQFLLGRGEGTIRAGGSLREASVGAIDKTFGFSVVRADVGSVFALGDARLSVTAGGSMAASVYDPLLAPAGRSQSISDAWTFGGTSAVGSFSAMTPASSIALAALGGNIELIGATNSAEPMGAVTALRAAPRSIGRSRTLLYRGLVLESVYETRTNALTDGDGEVSRQALPANVTLAAYGGDLGFQRAGAPSEGRSILLAPDPAASGRFELLAGGSILRPAVQLADAAPGALARPLRPFYEPETINVSGRRGADGRELLRNSTPDPVLDGPRRGLDPERALIYAVEGDISRPQVESAKRIGMRSGGDIFDMTLTVQHALPGDISFVWAGADIGTVEDPALAGSIFGNAIELRGPGRLQLLAGGNIAAIRPASNVASPSLGAIAADNGIRTTGNAANPAWPEGGAGIDVLYGIASPRGMDTLGFLDRVLGPGNTRQLYRVELTDTANGGVTWVIQAKAPAGTDAATLARIRGLPIAERIALSADLLMRELAASGADTRSSLSAERADPYTRGYAAIGALFPDSPGWRWDAERGRGELVGRPLYAGNLNLQSTYIRTEQGGDINVLGPGGDFLLGAISGTADRFPDRVGLLTLAYGNINIFGQGDILAGQSRVITADGGDILMWSSSADINAGLGARTARFVPPFRVTYLSDGTRLPDRAGLVTGSGISAYTPFTDPDTVAALLRTPATPAEAAAQAEERRRRTRPGITLIAPIGTVDAGDAGISAAAGNIVVAAQAVANAANIAAGGSTTGVPVVAAPNVGAAVSAAASAGSASAAAADVARQATQPAATTPAQAAPAVITVEILGFGGSEQEAQQLSQ